MKKLNLPKKALARLGVVVVVAAVVVLAVVLVNRQQEASKPSAKDFTSQLVKLGTDNTALLQKAINAELDSADNASDLKNSAYDNNEKLADLIGDVYGSAGKNTFVAAGRVYIDESLKYAAAGKAKNSDAQLEATDKITADYAKKLADYLAKNNRRLNKITVQAGFLGVSNGLQAAVNAHLAKQTDQEKVESQQAVSFAQAVHKYLAENTTKQFPSKFSNKD